MQPFDTSTAWKTRKNSVFGQFSRSVALWTRWAFAVWSTLNAFRSSRPGVLLGKGVLKICSKFTREYPCRRAPSVMLQSNFIEITLPHRCSPINLLHTFRTTFSSNTSRRLRLCFNYTEYGTGCMLIKQNNSISTKKCYQIYLKALLLPRENNYVLLPSCYRIEIHLSFAFS